MTIKNGAKGAGASNTNCPRISNSKNWTFTLNNWTEDDKNELLKICINGAITNRYIFQAEIGKEGTPHLQGYIEFKNKERPFNIFYGNNRYHWEKCRNVKASIAYCSKQDTSTGERWSNIILPKPLKIIDELYEWQKEVIEIIKTEPNDRNIYWFWESTGGYGKTQLAKYIIYHYGALLLSGKGADCKYAIVKHIETKETAPEIIIYDIPRCNNDYISYESLEAIKNGLFFSNKYESSQVIMNSPHIICFSNCPPDVSKMSADRWKIINLEQVGLPSINDLDN